MAGLYQRNVAPASANTPGMTAPASQGAAGGIPRGGAVTMPRTQGQALDVRRLGGLLGMLRNSAAGATGAAGGDAGSQAVSASPLAQAQQAWSGGQIGQNGALNPYAAQGNPGAGSFGPGLPVTAGMPQRAAMGAASGSPASGNPAGMDAANLQPGGAGLSGNPAGGFSGALAGMGAMAGSAAGNATGRALSGALAGSPLPGALAGASGAAQSLTAMPEWMRALTGGFNG
ncbi:MAG TPA: hypothetical protein IAB01_03150 [Candidatus Avidesulfovibrio excrementigallinarum]|nr:hypothetical protein [Candidatus Avidesulfovibrio excrementigallinarum]